MILTLPHRRPLKGISVFPRFANLDPYIRKFVSAFAHSNHERFIDPRHIISHAFYSSFSSGRVLTTFEPTVLFCFIGLGTLSADFTELHTS